MATNSVRESLGRWEHRAELAPKNSVSLHRRAFAYKVAASIGFAAAGALLATKGREYYRQFRLDQDMNHLHTVLARNDVSIVQQQIHGARYIVLFLAIHPTDDNNETNMRLLWLQEAIKKGYGSPPVMLFHVEEDGMRGISSDVHYELATTFAWSAARSYGIPYRSRQEAHAEMAREFDAIAATGHERETESGASIPAIVVYRSHGALQNDPPDFLWDWNHERLRNGERPLQGMQLQFHDIPPGSAYTQILTDR